jgi:DNA polymerase-3 subunit gamma/tau
LSRLSIYQHVGSIDDETEAVNPEIGQLAQALSPDLVQLFYTVAVHGRQELSLAPDEYAGFVMVCLKMLSFSANRPGAEKKTLKSDLEPVSPTSSVIASVSPPASTLAPVVDSTAVEPAAVEVATVEIPAAPTATIETVSVQPSVAQALDEPSAADGFGADFVQHWPALAAELPLTGMAQQCVRQSACLGASADELRLVVPTDSLAQGPHLDRVKQVIAQRFGAAVKLTVTVGDVPEGMSAHWVAEQAEKKRQALAVQTMNQDPFVQSLIQSFDARIVPGSIKPVSSPETP